LGIVSDTFKPRLTEDGKLQAGGMTLTEVDLETGQLVYTDRYRNRCIARGGTVVRVDLLDVLEAIMARLRETDT